MTNEIYSTTAGIVSANKSGTLSDLRELIHSARHRFELVAEQMLLYWRLGRRIRMEILGEARAAYCEQIVATESRQLEAEFGQGVGEKNVRRMVQFADEVGDNGIAGWHP